MYYNNNQENYNKTICVAHNEVFMFRHAHSVAKQMPQREKISILNESLTFNLSMEYEIVISFLVFRFYYSSNIKTTMFYDNSTIISFRYIVRHSVAFTIKPTYKS